MLTIAHRSASGALDRMWEFDPARRAVIVVLPDVAFDVPVCTTERPEQGHYHIIRLTEDAWRVAPAMFSRQGRTWTTKPFHYPDCHVDEFITLTCVPPNVRHELEAL